MGLFRRSRRAEGQAVEERDPDLPLSVTDAARLRSLVREVFAEAGVEVVVHADHVVDDGGMEFGLWNLALLCVDQPASAWPETVAAHVDNVRRPTPLLTDLSEDELRRSTYLRLVEGTGVPVDWDPSARLIGDALRVALSVDLPTTVMTPDAQQWARIGGSDRWREIGTANLRALLVSDDVVHQVVDTGDEGRFDVVMGDSFFTASLALLGEELVQRFAPRTDTSRGLLLAVPFRHQVAWRVVDGPEAAVALLHLFRFALGGVTDSPGPLSPHVYWVRGGEWRQLTDLSGESASVIMDPELEALMELPESG